MAQLPHNAKSLWRESYPELLYPALSDDIEVDVAVIGAGITGLTTAYLLKQAGKKVAVIDKATVGGGTSGRTTGKVTSQHNICYLDLQKHRGQTHAKAYADANQAGVEQIAQIIQTEQIACDWKRTTNVVYTTDPAKKKLFEQEATVARALGLPAHFSTTSSLPFDVSAVVEFADQGKINMQKYLLGLAQAVHGEGSFVFEKSPVSRIKDGTPSIVGAADGTVTAHDIVVATNVPCLPLMARGSYCLYEYPIISYIVAARTEYPLEGMYISPDKHGYSILPITVDGQHMMLIGGEGHFSAQPASGLHRQQKLAEFGQKHFGMHAIDYRWSDRDYIPYDNIPLVGKAYPWSKHLYVATAFKKWGLSNGTAAAMILCDTLMGVENQWAHTYATNRGSAVRAIPRAIARYIAT